MRLFATTTFLCLAVPALAQPLEITVESDADAGPGSLREALQEIADTGDLNELHVIDLRLLAGEDGDRETVIELASALPTITRSVRLLGPGRNLLTVEAGADPANRFRPFLILGDGSPTLDVQFHDFTIRGGSARGGNGLGGGGGGAGMGGAVFVRGAQLTVEGIRFLENTAEGGRGGTQEEFDAGLGEGGTWNGLPGAPRGANGRNGRRPGEAGGFGESGDGVTTGGGGRGGNGGDGANGGNGSNAVRDNSGFLGALVGISAPTNGGPGGDGADGGDGGGGGNGAFGGGGGGGGNGGNGGDGGDGGKGGNGDRAGFPVTINRNGADGGDGGDGGFGGQPGEGGQSGFGGGFGHQGLPSIGGKGGAGGAGGGTGPGGATSGGNAGDPGKDFSGFEFNAVPTRSSLTHGGVTEGDSRGGGGGAGLGGAIFVDGRNDNAGYLIVRDCEFRNNRALGGGANTPASFGEEKGGAIYHFVLSRGFVRFEDFPVFSQNAATDAGIGDKPNYAGTAIVDDSNYFGNLPGDFGRGYPANGFEEFRAITERLYYQPNAPGGSQAAKALRYRDLLFGGTGPTPAYLEVGPFHPEANPDTAKWFGTPEELAVAAEIAEIEAQLALHPDQADWGELLLDVFADRAVAEMIIADNYLSFADRCRLPVEAPLPESDLAIDEEIVFYTEAREQYRKAIDHYFTLFANPSHTQLFVERVPAREFRPATYLDPETGFARSTTPGYPAPGATGYRDYTLLIDLLGRMGLAASERATLLKSRNLEYPGEDRPSDVAAAEAQIGEDLRYLRLRRTLLEGLFPNLQTDAESTPGLPEAIDTLDVAEQALARVQTEIDSGTNDIGYDPDFLLLLPKDSFGPDTPFDSFDRFKLLLDPSDSTSRLGVALATLDEAQAAYRAYQETAANFADAREELRARYADRLAEIGDDDDPNSEIGQQLFSIELARFTIQENRAEISKLREEIAIEIERTNAEKQINNTIQNIQLEFRGRQQSLDRTIAYIEAVAAFSDGAAAGGAETTPVGFAGQMLNAGIQATAVLSVALAEQEQSRLAGLEQAAINDQENNRLDVNSSALIRTRLLDMQTLNIGSLKALRIFNQELARLDGLRGEKARLEARLAAVERQLDARYFGDPSQRVRFQESVERARFAFEDAQFWLFLMARALEYKYNIDFDHVYQGERWTTEMVFQTRHAHELERMYLAMADLDQKRNTNFADRYDWFSVREDLFGYREGLTDENGDPIRYNDPLTGEPVDAKTAFRSELRARQADGQITLNFSTLREIPNPLGTFFLGPRFNEDGSVRPGRAGLYLDKIAWMKVRLPGNHNTLGIRVIGTLIYGGDSFIRNREVGQPNAEDPSRIDDEFRVWSTRTWFFAGQDSDGKDIWRYLPQESATIDMEKGGTTRPRAIDAGTDPAVLAQATQIDQFAERSVATTDWTLIIETQVEVLGSTEDVLRIDELDDIEFFFYHRTAERVVP